MHKSTQKHQHTRPNHHDLSDDIERIKAALADASVDMKLRAGEILSDSARNVKNKSIEMQENAADYIAERPFKSLGMALLSGIIIGYFWRK